MASAQSGKKKAGTTAAKAKAPAAKAAASKAPAKKTPAAKAPAKKTAAPAKATGARKSAASGTKRTAGASKQRAASQTRAQKRAVAVEENPLSMRNSAVFLVDAPPAPRRDSGKSERTASPRRRINTSERTAPPPRRPKEGGSGGKSGGTRALGALNLVLLTAVIAFVCVGVWRTLEYRALAEMKEVVSRQTFYEGTQVEGVDVSGMTLREAVDYWNENIEPAYRQVAVVLDDGSRITAAELGYSSNYEEVLSGAWNAGRSGSLKQRYMRASSVGNSARYEVDRANFDDATVRSYAAYVASQVDAAPQDAHVSGFNPETYEFEFAQESNGYTLDQEMLVNAVESALNAGGGTVTRQIAASAPAVTLDNVAGQYGMIASAVTNAETSSSNRLSNIRLATSIINGTRLRPGESFSFNEVVGQRTTSRGFKVATAYSSGTVTEEVGGGICQVSTTLFNAVVKADLKVNERHPHSLTVGYVDLGKDAAVDWGNKDLKFTNTSDDDIYICGVVTDDKRVRFGIFGKLLPNGETITVEGVKTGEIDFEVQYQTSFELFTGQSREIQKGKKGYTATAYKIRWDANGNELSRTELCKSRYQATPEIIEVGP